jgi:hypothetical protein
MKPALFEDLEHNYNGAKKWKAQSSVGATNMQQPMFYILLHDYFISHQLLTRYCSLHLF